MTSLIVLGSANRDYTVVVARHPLPGETVLGGSVVVGTGGKGANQAAAAARAGLTPIFVGSVGADSTGGEILAELASVGVDVSHVSRSNEPTGVALITVSHAGENTIVVAPGANASLTADDVTSAVTSLATPGAVLLAQLEIPVEVVAAAANIVVQNGGRFVLNLSPSVDVPDSVLGLADPLVVNETEAAELAGNDIDGVADARVVAMRLLDSSRSVVITLGADGVVIADADGVAHVPSFRVPVVDTTGAGDAFAGALAASLANGSTLREAVDRGVAAGAAAVQWMGAQPPTA